MNMKTKGIRPTLIIAALSITCIISLSACAPQAASSDTKNNETEEAITVEWSPDADCSICHINQSESLSNSDCLVNSHSADQGLTCISCHVDESALKDVHKEVKTGDAKVKRLKETTVENSVCETCHDTTELASLTSSSSVLTDIEGTTVNPHDLPNNEKHATITCGNCHSMHSADSLEKTAMDTCISCHHKETFECGTCHDVD